MGLDEVAVDDADRPDAGPGQVIGQHGPQRPAAAERDPAPEQRPLALLAELREPDLAAVTVERLSGHHSSLLRIAYCEFVLSPPFAMPTQPPATAGMILTSSPGATGVVRSSR